MIYWLITYFILWLLQNLHGGYGRMSRDAYCLSGMNVSSLKILSTMWKWFPLPLTIEWMMLFSSDFTNMAVKCLLCIPSFILISKHLTHMRVLYQPYGCFKVNHMCRVLLNIPHEEKMGEWKLGPEPFYSLASCTQGGDVASMMLSHLVFYRPLRISHWIDPNFGMIWAQIFTTWGRIWSHNLVLQNTQRVYVCLYYSRTASSNCVICCKQIINLIRQH